PHRGRDAVHARRIEQAELIVAESIEPLPAEIGPVQMNRMKRGEGEVLREAEIVFRIRPIVRIEGAVLAPCGPRRPSKRLSIREERVATLPVLVADALAVGR